MFDAILTMLLLLIAGHFLADYPLQGPFLSKEKCPNNLDPIVPWQHAMTAHCAIHGGVVLIVTGIWWLFVAEFIIHFATDHAKCQGKIGTNTDQAIHLGCKVLWVLIAVIYAIWRV